MPACERFEREGLLRLEQGLGLDDHFGSCPACREARAAYEGLQSAIHALAADREPPSGWEARVLAATRLPARASPGWRWLLPAAALAASLGALAFMHPWSRRPLPASIVTELGASDNITHRTAEARPGQRVTLRAATGGARHAELRLYRDDTRLLLRCSSEPPCHREGDALSANAVLENLGIYQPVLVTSDRPIPEASGFLDRDAGAAFGAGGEFILAKEIRVH